MFNLHYHLCWRNVLPCSDLTRESCDKTLSVLQSEYPEVSLSVITKLAAVLLSWRLQTPSCGWRITGGRVRIPRTSQSRPMQLSRYFKHNFATNWIRVGSSDNISILTSVHASNSILEEDDVTRWHDVMTQWWLESSVKVRRELWYNLNIFICFTTIFGKI